jgi:hypothetical protein
MVVRAELGWWAREDASFWAKSLDGISMTWSLYIKTISITINKL